MSQMTLAISGSSTSFATYQDQVGASTNRNRTKPQRFLQGKIIEGWEIVYPLPVTVELAEGNDVLVSDALFCVYGEGESEEIATLDYARSLVEYYEIMGQKTDKPTRKLFSCLQLYLRPIP